MNNKNIKYCPSCGTELYAGAIFCKQCGKKLAEQAPYFKKINSTPNTLNTTSAPVPVQKEIPAENRQTVTVTHEASRTKPASSILIILDTILLWLSVVGMLTLIPSKTISIIAVIISTIIGIYILGKSFKKMKNTTNGALLILLCGIGVLIYTLLPHIRMK